jgi:ABC-type Fe3+-siderophore transport system permease subunit
MSWKTKAERIIFGVISGVGLSRILCILHHTTRNTLSVTESVHQQ